MAIAGKYGLIGASLKHSFSKNIHAMLGEYSYDLYELRPEELAAFVYGDITAFNVTIPYKKDIIPFLDVIDEKAKRIGAVNTVVKRDGKIYGYNTDFDGMYYMLNRAGISLEGKKVMILGTGGTGVTARAVAEYAGAKDIVVVSRSGVVNYDNAYEHTDTEVIINTTPVGMFPSLYAHPIEPNRFPELCGVADVIYNPNMTELTYEAMKMGIAYTNGLPMLVAQAKYAAEHFHSTIYPDETIERILCEMWRDKQNLVLIGMPGSGKSTIASLLAEMTGKPVVDTDLEIEREQGRSIPDIFAAEGEGYFREREREVLRRVCSEGGKIIATGGGVVKSIDNEYPMRANGKVFWIKRDVERLARQGRPLSKDIDAVRRLYAERLSNYESFCDFEIDNNGDVADAAQRIMELL